MDQIKHVFDRLKKNGHLGIMAHAVVGWPTLSESEEIIKTLAQNGADLIELQIPFSDPIADGPTILHASDLALSAGIKVSDAFALAKKLKDEIQTPLLFMTYGNILLARGIEAFCAEAAESGIVGLIVPDLPPEEAPEFFEACEKYHLAPIVIFAPTADKKRLQELAAVAKGFVYCVARTGITGAATDFSELHQFLDAAKSATNLPLAVGFGVEKPEDLHAIKKAGGHMAVVGSAALRAYSSGKIPALKQFFSSLSHAV